MGRPDLKSCELVVREYDANDGREYFITYENEDKTTLYGFLRLRLSPNAGAGVFDELINCALIRELHVYGQVVAVGDTDDKVSQHVGFGTGLLRKAEEIAVAHGYTKIAVISGVGTREYYRKRGFENSPHFLIKTLDKETVQSQGEVVLRAKPKSESKLSLSSTTSSPSQSNDNNESILSSMFSALRFAVGGE